MTDGSPGRHRPLAVLGLVLASAGFVLQSPVGVVAAVGLVVATRYAPAPFEVAFGVVAFAALVESPAGTQPDLVAVGLLALLAASGPSLRRATGRVAVAIAAVPTLGLAGGYVVAPTVGLPAWLGAVAVASTSALLLYGVHRYERVTLGLIDS